MQRQAILLIAGTCIGSGMIALPMILAKLGIIPSVIIMLCTWFFAYHTSLVSVELNLHLDRGAPLGQLGKIFSGKTAEIIGTISVKLLSYSLLAVYIYGGTSIIQKLIQVYYGYFVSNCVVATTLSLITMVVITFPIKIISKLNSMLFSFLIILFLSLIAIMIMHCDLNKMPMIVDMSLENIISVISVVFTSFGYQVIFHTLRNCCGKNVKLLKNAFLYGSLIPAIIYIMWASVCLSIIYNADYYFYQKMVNGSIDVGDLVNMLTLIANIPNLQVLIWWLSILAIVTSILGVGISLSEPFNLMLKNKLKNTLLRKATSSILTIVPAYIIAVLTPNAFIKILGFAGTILVIIAVLLPIYLLYKSKIKDFYIKSINNKWLLMIYILIGIGIMFLEFL